MAMKKLTGPGANLYGIQRGYLVGSDYWGTVDIDTVNGELLMDLTYFENGLELHANDIRASIHRLGLHVRHVDGLSYTVGFDKIGFPELLIETAPAAHAEELFLTMYTAARYRLRNTDHWHTLAGTLDPKPLFLDLPEDRKRQVFVDARTGYGHWDFRANLVQLPHQSGGLCQVF